MAKKPNRSRTRSIIIAISPFIAVLLLYLIAQIPLSSPPPSDTPSTKPETPTQDTDKDQCPDPSDLTLVGQTWQGPPGWDAYQSTSFSTSIDDFNSARWSGTSQLGFIPCQYRGNNARDFLVSIKNNRPIYRPQNHHFEPDQTQPNTLICAPKNGEASACPFQFLPLTSSPNTEQNN